MNITPADVARIRELAGQDQVGFGRALGVSQRTIRGWEAGGTIPDSAQVLLAAAEAALSGNGKTWAANFAQQLRSGGRP